MARPLLAAIDLDALRHNYRLAQELAPSSQTMAVLKANAYGHGIVACARALEDIAPAFAVACLEEALTLREAGITTPILLLEGIFDAAEIELVDTLGLWMTVHSHWQVEALLDYHPTKPIALWVKVDSGMHRLGFLPQEAEALWKRLQADEERVGKLYLMSHFATADLLDSQQFRQQLSLLQDLAGRLNASVCLANSPATLAWPQTHGEWNRPGIMLYGSDPLEGANDASRRLKPVMTLRSKIIALREVMAGEPVGYGGRWHAPQYSRIAVVACGYGDGYDRHAQDGTPVLVEGQRASLAGRVSMDMLTIDVSHIPAASIGSEVVLWGQASTGEVLSVDEVAYYSDTISYTLLTGILPRVPRCCFSCQ